MSVGLGVERVDVLPVLGQRLRHRLALGRQDFVLDTLDVGRALGFGLSVTACRFDLGPRLAVDQFQRVGRGLPPQRGLLGQRIGQQSCRLADQRGFGLLRDFQRGLLLLVACLHGLDLALQVGFDDRRQPLVGLGHLGSGVVDRLVGLADGLLDLPKARLQLLQGTVDGLDATPDRFLGALTHSLQPLGDLLGGGGGGVHRALGGVRPLGRVGVHLREDLVHLREAGLVALGGLLDGVRRENRLEYLPAVLQLLDAFHQHLDHEDARLADDLEFL